MKKLKTFLAEAKISDITSIVSKIARESGLKKFKISRRNDFANFLYVSVIPEYTPRGVYTKMNGQDTMSGKDEKESIAKCKKALEQIFSQIKKIANIEDFEISEKNGKITLFMVSDDFHEMDPIEYTSQ